MKVVHIISSFAVEGPLGGVARYVIELGRAFDPTEVELTVVGLWDYHTGFEREHCVRLNQEGIRAMIAAEWEEGEPYQSCVRSLASLRQIQWGKIDIVHGHGEFSDLAAIFLGRNQRAKATVRTVHNEIEWSKRPLYGRILPNLLYPFAFTQELAISRQVATNLNRRFLAHVRGHRAPVVYNGIDFGRFQKAAPGNRIREELGLVSSAPIVGTIGRLTRQKGYDILLEAMPALVEQHPDVVLIIIGDGPLRRDLEVQAQELGIRHAVHFTGPRKDIEHLLPGMDLFVSSSRWEGLPTVVLESVAAGVPTVATAVSGSVELIQHQVNGLLVPPEDPATLSAAMLEILGNMEKYRDGSESARRDAAEKFSLGAIAGQLQYIYRHLMAV